MKRKLLVFLLLFCIFGFSFPIFNFQSVNAEPYLVDDAQRWTSYSARISESIYFTMIEMNAPLVVGQHDLFRSTDSGETWENMGCVSETFGSNESLTAAAMAVDINDNNILHITWQGYGTPHFIQKTIWNNTAGAFQQNVTVIDQRGFLHWMEIDSNNVLHIVWDDMTTDDGVNVHLRYMSSADGGDTWGFYLLDEQTNHDFTYFVDDDDWLAQAVNTTWIQNVEVVSFYHKDTNSPAVTLRCDVYASTGTYGSTAEPTGGILASSDALDFDSVPDNSWFNFTFSTPWEPTLAVVYEYVIKETVGSQSIGFGVTTPSNHDGNIADTADSGSSWVPIATVDIAFRIYGSGPELLDTNSWNDWYVNHQILVTKNNVLNVAWRENDPGAKNHRYMYTRRFTNGTWVPPEDTAGSWDSLAPAGGSDWSSGPNDRLIRTYHNGSSGFSPISGADIYVGYTTEATNYTGALTWSEPSAIGSGKVFIQDPSVQIDDSGAAHIISQEWIPGWSVGEFPNPSVGNLSLHYMREDSFPWNNWRLPVRLNDWHSQCGFGFFRGSAFPAINRVDSSATLDLLFMVWQGVDSEYDIMYQLLSLIIDMTGYITDMDADSWLYVEEKYYTFVGNVTLINADLDVMEMRFTDAGGQVLQFFFKNATTDYVSVVEDAVDYIRVRMPAAAQIDGNLVSITFEVLLTRRVLDSLLVDLWMNANTTTGEEIGWTEVQHDYFNINNLGGFSTLETSGTAGRIAGGDIFELYAESNSWAMANMTFYKLQHIHLMFHPWVANQRLWDDWETDTITIEMGLDYYSETDNAWLSGWSVYLEQYEGWLDASTMRLRWTVKWYYRGAQVLSTTMNSFPLVNETGDAGLPALTSFITDFWFNKVNASSTVGGRITSEYFAMRDNADPWLRWATGSNWGADVGNVTQSMFFEDLENSTGDIISSRQLEMMRVWVRLEQADNVNNVRVELRDYDLFDVIVAQDEMQGVNTPIFIATKTPDMPQGGFLNALWGSLQDLFRGISDLLGPVVLTFWDVFVGFLDSVAGAVGAPYFFTNLFNWIGEMIGYLGTSAVYLLSMIGGIFILMESLLAAFLIQMANLISSIVTFFQYFTGMMGGAYGAGVNVWEDLGISQWIMVAMIFYPLYLIYLWEERGMDAVIQQLTWIFGILSWLFTFFVSVIQFTIYLITSVIESIPVAE